MMWEVVLELRNSQFQDLGNSAVNAENMTVRVEVRYRPMIPIVGAFLRYEASEGQQRLW